MKILLIGIFAVVMTFALSADLTADENTLLLFPGSLSLNNYAFLNGDLNGDIDDDTDGELDAFTGEDKWVFREFSTGQRIGAGFLNLFLGLGSFIMSDTDGGLEIMFRQLMGIGIPALFGVIMFPFLVPAGAGIEAFGQLGILFAGPLLWVLVPVAVVFGLYAVSSFVTSWIYGFRRPFLYQKPVSTANLNDARNWDIGLLPDTNGGLKTQIAFTAHF